jgi:thioredoxin 2
MPFVEGLPYMNSSNADLICVIANIRFHECIDQAGAIIRREGSSSLSECRHIVCPRCAAVNRVPAGRDASTARCGACKVSLFAATPMDADRAMLERQVTRSTIPVLVDVWAPWCAPCRVMAPAFAEAAHALEPGMRLIKLNAQEEPEAAAGLGVQGIPTMLLFADGREVARVSGAMSSAEIVAWARRRMRS